MNEKDCKYVWEKSRGVYRVVIDTSEYNNETKKTAHHYVTVGKAREKGGEIEFGPKYRAIEKAGRDASGDKVPKAKGVTLSGERMVLDHACRESGLGKAVCGAFGKETSAKVLALAYYLIASGDALSNAAPWLGERGLAAMDAPRVSELLPSLGEEACSAFFKAWISAKAPGRTLCYDITSVSTYDHDSLSRYPFNGQFTSDIRFP